MSELIGLRLDDKIVRWLKDEAARRFCSLSQVVRDAVVAAMEKSKQNKDPE